MDLESLRFKTAIFDIMRVEKDREYFYLCLHLIARQCMADGFFVEHSLSETPGIRVSTYSRFSPSVLALGRMMRRRHRKISRYKGVDSLPRNACAWAKASLYSIVYLPYLYLTAHPAVFAPMIEAGVDQLAQPLILILRLEVLHNTGGMLTR